LCLVTSGYHRADKTVKPIYTKAKQAHKGCGVDGPGGKTADGCSQQGDAQ